MNGDFFIGVYIGMLIGVTTALGSLWFKGIIYFG